MAVVALTEWSVLTACMINLPYFHLASSQILRMLEQHWENKVLHTPIVYRASSFPGCGQVAQLEEVSPLWLTQASDLYVLAVTTTKSA